MSSTFSRRQVSSCRPPLLVFGPQFATASVGLRAAVGKALPSAGRRRWSSRRSWQTSQQNHVIMVPFSKSQLKIVAVRSWLRPQARPRSKQIAAVRLWPLGAAHAAALPKRWRLPDSGARGRTGNHGQPRPPNSNLKSAPYPLAN